MLTFVSVEIGSTSAGTADIFMGKVSRLKGDPDLRGVIWQSFLEKLREYVR